MQRVAFADERRDGRARRVTRRSQQRDATELWRPHSRARARAVREPSAIKRAIDRWRGLQTARSRRSFAGQMLMNEYELARPAVYILAPLLRWSFQAFFWLAHLAFVAWHWQRERHVVPPADDADAPLLALAAVDAAEKIWRGEVSGDRRRRTSRRLADHVVGAARGLHSTRRARQRDRKRDRRSQLQRGARRGAQSGRLHSQSGARQRRVGAGEKTIKRRASLAVDRNRSMRVAAKISAACQSAVSWRADQSQRKSFCSRLPPHFGSSRARRRAATRGRLGARRSVSVGGGESR